jgi:hypothetical protein
MQVDDFGEQLASLMGSMLGERAALFEDSSSSDSQQPNPNDGQRDDAGVPVTRNYHPHLDGMLHNGLIKYGCVLTSFCYLSSCSMQRSWSTITTKRKPSTA